MKKVFLTLMLAVASATAGAAEFSYLAVQLKSGSQIFFKATDLRFKVADDNLNVYNAEGITTLVFNDLESMMFTADATSLSGITATVDGSVEVFTVAGVRVGSFDSASEAVTTLASPGVYLMKSESETIKIVVAK